MLVRVFKFAPILGICAAALISSSCSVLEPIPTELDEAAYSCIQNYAPEGDPMLRVSGESAPESKFLPVNLSKDALEWRLALADKATTTLDIQYFLWKTDEAGTYLIQRVLSAADRGVHVRLLMDDLDSVNWNNRAIALNSHPDIEVRVFNPFKRRGSKVQRGLELITDLGRLNHRMHNKLFMIDEKIAIVGGRNIGNEYFGLGSSLDYRDYDLIAMGPIVEELTDSFQVFWNSDWSYPLEALHPEPGDMNLKSLRNTLTKEIETSGAIDETYLTSPDSWDALISSARDNLSTGMARVVYDCPPGFEDQRFPVQSAYTLNRIAEMTQKEVLIVSPYFVPLETLRRHFRETIGRGVKITLYTNSLAAADHTHAFSGYARHRRELLDMGMEIRELKPDAEIWPLHRTDLSIAGHISLHAKMMIFDRRWVYVGSMNLDPRSAHWNTEMGLLIDNETLAERIYQDIGRDLKQDSSWTVELYPVSNGSGDVVPRSEELIWMSGDEVLTEEPTRGFLHSLSKWFFGLFPLDEQL